MDQLQFLENGPEDELSLSNAAAYLGISKQGVYHAMQHGRIEFKKNKAGSYRVKRDTLDKYIATRHDRNATIMLNGKPLKETEYLNVEQASKESKVPKPHLYYCIYKGVLPHQKVGAQYIFRRKDIEAYALKYWGVKDAISVG